MHRLAWWPGPDGCGPRSEPGPLLFSPIVAAFFQYLVPDPAGSNTRYGVPATAAGVAGTGAIGSPGPAGGPAGQAAANDGRVFPGRPAGALPAHCYPQLDLPTAATQAPRPWTTPPSATGSMLRRPFTPGKVVDNSARCSLTVLVATDGLKDQRHCRRTLRDRLQPGKGVETATQTLQNTTASCAGQRPWITGQA